MTNDQLKITFLTVMPSPYVQDLFAEMSADARIDLTVWYLEQVAPDTYWGEQAMPDYARVLPGRWYGFSGARVHWNPGISKLIDNSEADLFVIVGYIGLTNQVATRTLNRLGRKWVFWGEVPGLHQRGWLGSQIRRLLQKPLLKAAGIAAVGSRAVAAYQDLIQVGNPRCVFRNIPYHCRLDEFEAKAVERARRGKGENARWGEGEKGRMAERALRFLYCGQLIERKGVDLLCRAFSRLVASGVDVTLTLAGEGPLRSALEQSLMDECRDRVVFMGFQAVEALPAIFGQADCFVLPSRHDGWGVVINQAIAAGLPVIATRAVGAAIDLVEHHVNGCVIEPNSEDAIFEAMTWMVGRRNLVPEMGRRSSEMAERISLRQAVNDWCEFFGASCVSVSSP
jgi:glycosyltransferase involved in cell wall biosynthesis